MRFRILGTSAASRDGESAGAGGERQRALFALLLVHANEMVSTERLIEQLFGGSRRASSANAMHVAVSRLRRTLRRRRRQMLLPAAAATCLEIDPDQLDAALFERLLEEGGELLARWRPGRQRRRGCARRSPCGGPPLADLGVVEDVQPEVRRLEELRVLAEMERIDAELPSGAPAEVVVELERLIAGRPCRSACAAS